MKNQLRIIYSDIIRGYSPLETPDFSGVFIKHLTPLDISVIDEVYEENFNKALENGILSEQDQLKFLNEQDIWTEKQEKEISNIKENIEILIKSRDKCILNREKLYFQDEANKETNKLKLLEQEKIKLIGITAETFATKKSNDFYLYISLINKNNISFFNLEEFNELDEKILNKLIEKYNKKIENFSEVNIQKIALSSFFMNSYCLVDDDIYSFFGKPMVDLTYYQTDLLNNGRIFKAILSESGDSLDKKLLNEPSKLLEWYKNKKTAKATIDNLNKNTKDGGGTGFVGATKEDLERLGVKADDMISFSDTLSQKGKNSLSFEEIIAAHGD